MHGGSAGSRQEAAFRCFYSAVASRGLGFRGCHWLRLHMTPDRPADHKENSVDNDISAESTTALSERKTSVGILTGLTLYDVDAILLWVQQRRSQMPCSQVLKFEALSAGLLAGLLAGFLRGSREVGFGGFRFP